MAQRGKKRSKRIEPDAWTDHYSDLDDTEKELESERGLGLFTFPQDIVGKTDHGHRSFVVFYFDRKSDYDYVVDKLAIKGRGQSAPYMDTKTLIAILKEEEG